MPDETQDQTGPTCPLSDEEIYAFDREFDRGTYTADFAPHRDRALLRAAIAADRARLREALKTSVERVRFDIACRAVDEATREGR